MVEFFTEDITFDTTLLKSVPTWLRQIATNHQTSITSLNYVFCSDEYLLAINRQYLNHDYYTDIITFDQSDEDRQPIEGDIFISIDRVYENAGTRNTESFHELLRVIVHGLLHLLGYSDDTKESKLQMRCLEDESLHLYDQLTR